MLLRNPENANRPSAKNQSEGRARPSPPRRAWAQGEDFFLGIAPRGLYDIIQHSINLHYIIQYYSYSYYIKCPGARAVRRGPVRPLGHGAARRRLASRRREDLPALIIIIMVIVIIVRIIIIIIIIIGC